MLTDQLASKNVAYTPIHFSENVLTLHKTFWKECSNLGEFFREVVNISMNCSKILLTSQLKVNVKVIDTPVNFRKSCSDLKILFEIVADTSMNFFEKLWTSPMKF